MDLKRRVSESQFAIIKITNEENFNKRQISYTFNNPNHELTAYRPFPLLLLVILPRKSLSSDLHGFHVAVHAVNNTATLRGAQLLTTLAGAQLNTILF